MVMLLKKIHRDKETTLITHGRGDGCRDAYRGRVMFWTAAKKSAKEHPERWCPMSE